MWPFNKKRAIAASGILQGAVDHHSHILPGVDDGVESMDEALRILATYEAAGIKELWLTPHIMEDIPNTPGKLLTRFAELQAAYTGSITLHLAAEYMIDNNLHKLLQNNCDAAAESVKQDKNCPSYRRGTSNARCIAEGVKDNSNSPSSKREYPLGEGVKENPLLPIGNKGNHLLVETSYYNPPMRFKETLRQIKSLGYYPLLAHPERYMYMDNDEYRRLREEGIKFQLNIVSLAGGYGRAVKKKAEWLLENRLYSVCGSDLHSEDAIEYIKECKLNNRQIELMKELLHSNI